METSRTCHVCGTVCCGPCPTCTAALAQRRPVAEMTPAERCAELRFLGVLEIPLNLFHQRAAELVGRSVYSHEFTDLDSLCDEIRGKPADLEEIMSKVPAKKLVVVGVTEA